MTNVKYHDEKHVDAQKFNKNYVTNDTQKYFVNIFVKQAKIYICKTLEHQRYIAEDNIISRLIIAELTIFQILSYISVLSIRLYESLNLCAWISIR